MITDEYAAAWVGLINPKSPANVGQVLRAAGCFGVRGICYTGERFRRASAFVSDTRDVHEHIPLAHCEDLLGAVPEGVVPVAVEFVEGAVLLPTFTHPARALYCFGPEDGSLPQSLVDRCEAVVYLPTEGCLNLAATVNVVLYDRMLKSGRFDADPGLILRSRDTNNRLRR